MKLLLEDVKSKVGFKWSVKFLGRKMKYLVITMLNDLILFINSIVLLSNSSEIIFTKSILFKSSSYLIEVKIVKLAAFKIYFYSHSTVHRLSSRMSLNKN